MYNCAESVRTTSC